MHHFHWVKATKNGKINNSIGHYFQHGTETCIIAYKGVQKIKVTPELNNHAIWAERQLQSQKPNVLHKWFEEKVPEGNYCELFGRCVNLRSKWTTIGFQVIPDSNECWMFLKYFSNQNQTGGSVVL